MSRKVDFEFTQKYGSIVKGTKKELGVAHARSLQDVRKVGKIVVPEADKADPKAKGRATK